MGYRTPPRDSPPGHGELADLWEVNKTWLTPGLFDYPGSKSAFVVWNLGQQMIVPPKWQPIPGEYEGPMMGPPK